MGGGYRHTGVARQTDRHCRRHLRGHTLRIGHAFLTDLLADGGRHTTPANHRTDTKRQRDGHDDPDWRVLNGVEHIAFQFLQQTFVVTIHLWQLRDFIGHIRDTEHDTTKLTTLFYSQFVVAFDIAQHAFRTFQRVNRVCRMAVELARRGGCTGFRRRDQLINAGRFFQQVRMLLEIGFNVVDRIAGTGDFVT